MTARELWVAASVCLGSFVATVILQHAVVPELPPGQHVISEYVNADAGAVMVAGFVVWATGLAAMSMLVLRSHRLAVRTRSRRLLAVCLGLAAVGALFTAAFPTQAIESVVPQGEPRTTAGQLHDLGSGLVTLTVLVACFTSWRTLPAAVSFRRGTIALVVVAVIANVTLIAIGDPAPGVRQRILVASACAWQAALLAQLSPARPSSAVAV